METIIQSLLDYLKKESSVLRRSPLLAALLLLVGALVGAWGVKLFLDERISVLREQLALASQRSTTQAAVDEDPHNPIAVTLDWQIPIGGSRRESPTTLWLADEDSRTPINAALHVTMKGRTTSPIYISELFVEARARPSKNWIELKVLRESEGQVFITDPKPLSAALGWSRDTPLLPALLSQRPLTKDDNLSAWVLLGFPEGASLEDPEFRIRLIDNSGRTFVLALDRSSGALQGKAMFVFSRYPERDLSKLPIEY